MPESISSWFATFTADTGEVPQCVVFADRELFDYNEETGKYDQFRPNEDGVPSGVLLSLEDAAPALGRTFDVGYGGTEARPFTAWSRSWVLFPACYDGAEWCEWVPRYPDTQQAPTHRGGG